MAEEEQCEDGLPLPRPGASWDPSLHLPFTCCDQSPFTQLPAPPCQERCHHQATPKDVERLHSEGARASTHHSPNHLEAGVLLLDVVHHGDLIHRVPLG